jgi:hypothetical protein
MFQVLMTLIKGKGLMDLGPAATFRIRVCRNTMYRRATRRVIKVTATATRLRSVCVPDVKPDRFIRSDVVPGSKEESHAARLSKVLLSHLVLHRPNVSTCLR